jgi:hypothetical protein
MNAILGKSKGPTVVKPPERIGEPGKGWGERCSSAELCTMFLDGLGLDAFRHLTGLPVKDGNDPAHVFQMMRRKGPKVCTAAGSACKDVWKRAASGTHVSHRRRAV